MPTTKSGYPLGDDVIAAFERDGAVHLPAVLDHTLTTRLGAAADRILSAESNRQGRDHYFKRLNLWRTHPGFRDACMNSPVPAIAAKLLGAGKVNLLYDQLFVKDEGSGVRTPWHNDLPYWPLTGTQVLTVWLALDPIVRDNGALEFIRGSHRWNRRYRPFYTDDDGHPAHSFHADGDEFDELPRFEDERDRHDIVWWDMEPGDAIAFHGLTVHGAAGHCRPGMRRRGLAIRLTGDDVRYRAGAVWNQDLVSENLAHGAPLDSPQFPLVHGTPGADR
jgi:ectoine hydroxylase-related dioxygenase (phytanoyl-CoA dioxygenase family)